MAYLVDLSGDDPLDLEKVGGKALNLGVLTRAGFDVPRGFCLTTDAYREVVGRRLDLVLTRLGSAVEPSQLSALAAEARQIVGTAAIPALVRGLITARYRTLGTDRPVAVRSSATAEDLELASFAGQQDTFLNVVGSDAVVAAVRRCWASLWTERAVSYRTQHGVAHEGLALAVVIQELVDTAAAGVLFTANPVTGSRSESVVDASAGLGESVVSGAVNPDHFVVAHGEPRVIQRRLGDKRQVVRARPQGGTEVVERGDSSATACVPDDQVAKLVRLGARVAAHLGSPQDIEWALDRAGRIWLTQSRPITTLYPLLDHPRGGPSPASPDWRVYFCVTLAQGLTRPITPMGLSAFRMISASVAEAAGRQADPAAGAAGIRVAGQRLFIDATPIFRQRQARRLLLAALGVMEARSAAVLDTLRADPRFSLIGGSLIRAGRPVARILLAVGAPAHVVIAIVRPALAYRAFARERSRLEGALRLPENVSAERRLDHVVTMLRTDTFWVMPRMVAYAAPGFLTLALARRLLGDLARPGQLATVLRGLPHNVTTEMDLALWQLTEEIRRVEIARQAFLESTVPELTVAYQAGALPGAAERGLAAFLAAYGHRAVAEIDLGMPRWSADPAHLLGVIKNYLSLDDPALAPPNQFSRGAHEAEEVIAGLVGRLSAEHPTRAGVVRWSLRRTRQLAGLRESPKFLLVLILARLRDHLQRVGDSLVEARAIAEPEDIFFLDLAEARRGLQGEAFSSVVAERRAAYATELQRRHVPRVLLSDGTELEALAGSATGAGASDETGVLHGSPASAGTVTGLARVVLDPVGAEVRPGEILIAPSTDPGWTPLFLTAGGLVMEMGGSNSHGAVVAREYGIPAVVGVRDATSKIATGQAVTVDGAAGLVRVG